MTETFAPPLFGSLDGAFRALVKAAADSGSHGLAASNASDTWAELTHVSFCIEDPRRRVIEMPERRVNTAYLATELIWQLAKRSDVEFLASSAPKIGRFSADGTHFTGSAYGEAIFGPQWQKCRSALDEDASTRRALIVLADSNEDISKANLDVTCTTSLHFMVRDGALDVHASMRSNDIMRGLQGDIFLFTVVQEWMALETGLRVGRYFHHANVMQIFMNEKDWSVECSNGTEAQPEPTPPISLPHWSEAWRSLEGLIESDVEVDRPLHSDDFVEWCWQAILSRKRRP